MQSFFKKLDLRADFRFHSQSSTGHVDPSTSPVGHSHVRPRTAQPSAACRGLYAAPKRRTTEHAHNDDQDELDPIIRGSIYPQMNGKRRSELEAQYRPRSTKYDEVSDGDRGYGNVARIDRPVRRQQTPSTAQRAIVTETVKAPSKPQQTSAVRSNASSSEARLTWSPSSRAFKRSSLPGDEYRYLVRRQKMQQAREVLELHYAHQGSARSGYIEHGMMQRFTVRNSERRQLSKVHYAVRKALQANLNLNDNDFKLALNHHADRVHFCELTDVDGKPVDEQTIRNFISLYQEAQKAAIEANLLGRPLTEPVQWTGLDERSRRDLNATHGLQRVDSAVAMAVHPARPRLVSKFSWDSNDGAKDSQKRLIKTKR